MYWERNRLDMYQQHPYALLHPYALRHPYVLLHPYALLVHLAGDGFLDQIIQSVLRRKE